MKKTISVILAIFMLTTVFSICSVPASALSAGTTIYVNAYEAGWSEAYIYGWDCGLQGTYIKMEQTPHQGIFSFKLPQASQDGMQYFFFANKNTWTGQEQTIPLATASGKNFYTLYGKDGNGKWTGLWSYVAPPTDPPTQPTEPQTEPPTPPPTQPPTKPTDPPTQPTEPPTHPPKTPKGTQIIFDNREAQWTDVYVYGWRYGFYGEFIKIQETVTPGVFSFTLPEDVEYGLEFFVFVNQAGWGGRQTVNIAAQPGMNMVTPTVTASGNMPVTWSYIYPPAPPLYVMATPSRSFAERMDVVLYTNCEYAEYSVNGSDSMVYEDGSKLTIDSTATLVITGYDENFEIVGTATYTYTRVGMTTISANVTGAAGRPVYVYLFGGDRINTYFYEMNMSADGTYTFVFEGAAQVIFTTTNDWATAYKLNTDEPLIAAGSTTTFDLLYPY